MKRLEGDSEIISVVIVILSLIFTHYIFPIIHYCCMGACLKRRHVEQYEANISSTDIDNQYAVSDEESKTIFKTEKSFTRVLHGPSMLAVKAKIYGVLYKQSSSIAFDETSSYWSALKAPNFSAFHWSPHSNLVSIGQNFVTTRVVHLPKMTETSLITESDQSGANHQLLQVCTARTAWSESDQAMLAVHSCISWFSMHCTFWSYTWIIFLAAVSGMEDEPTYVFILKVVGYIHLPIFILFLWVEMFFSWEYKYLKHKLEEKTCKAYTVDSRYLDLGYLE